MRISDWSSDVCSSDLLEKKAARKSLGVRQRQARAIRFKGDITDFDSPASGVCLAHLLKACRRDELGLRDAALLRVAYDAGCRRSELVAILLPHIEKDAKGGGTVFLPSSKHYQTGGGVGATRSAGKVVGGTDGGEQV